MGSHYIGLYMYIQTRVWVGGGGGGVPTLYIHYIHVYRQMARDG